METAKAHNKAQETMRRNRKRYIEQLSKQIERLDTLLGKITQTGLPAGAVDVHHIAHQMKGSAPIFGFPRIGGLADELNDRWRWAADGEVAPELLTMIGASQDLLMNIRMEFATYVKEMQLDEDQQNELAQAAAATFHSQGRLLLVDDDDLLRSHLVGLFEVSGYEVEEASDVETAKRLLHEKTYDLIILDLIMYPDSGYELFDYVKKDPTLKWEPLIVLSGRDDLEDKVRCLRLGADDYVTKPFRYEELEARVTSLLRRTRQFEQMAFRDALTGVFNRRYFDHQIYVDLQRAKREGMPISLAFIDIDRFKRVNDTYGHHVGDQVLQGLGHMLQQSLRETDLLARYGGEELVIVMPHTDLQQAVGICERILERVREQPMARTEHEELYITFSGGVAEWEEAMGSLESWIATADQAMYQAKESGRNRIVAAEAGRAAEDWSLDQNHAVKPRLLLVDDDEIISSLVASHLGALNIEIVQATDGDQALDLLRGQSFDLCILDGLLPGLDGYDVLQTIKANTRLCKLKVLMLSTRKREEDIVRGLQLGASDYMTKPFSMIELEIRVKRLMNLA